MQTIIDIPDRIYNILKDDKSLISNVDRLAIVFKELVKKGTPLPKGHGKIVDLGNIDKDRIEQDNPVIYLTVNGEYIEAVSLDYLNSLQAIIEEDKEVSE